MGKKSSSSSSKTKTTSTTNNSSNGIVIGSGGGSSTSDGAISTIVTPTSQPSQLAAQSQVQVQERTIQVKIGNQEPKVMTHSQAAEYLKSIALAASSSSTSTTTEISGTTTTVTASFGSSTTTCTSGGGGSSTGTSTAGNKKGLTSSSSATTTTVVIGTGPTSNTKKQGNKVGMVGTGGNFFTNPNRTQGLFQRELKMTFENGTTSTVPIGRIFNKNNSNNSNNIQNNNSNNSIMTNVSNTNNNAAALLSNGTVRSAHSSNNNNNNHHLIGYDNNNNNPTTNIVSNNSLGNPNSNNSTMTSTNNIHNQHHNMNNTTTRADGMPCSEKEMKALMSMFVEIMGLQMNTDRLNQISKGNGGGTTQVVQTTQPQITRTDGGNDEENDLQQSNTKKKNSTSTTGGSVSNTHKTTQPPTTTHDSVAIVGTSSNDSSSSNNKKGKKKIMIPVMNTGTVDGDTTTIASSPPQNPSIGMGNASAAAAASASLFQFPPDLPPPPGGWPDDLLWPSNRNNGNGNTNTTMIGNSATTVTDGVASNSNQLIINIPTGSEAWNLIQKYENSTKNDTMNHNVDANNTGNKTNENSTAVTQIGDTVVVITTTAAGATTTLDDNGHQMIMNQGDETYDDNYHEDYNEEEDDEDEEEDFDETVDGSEEEYGDDDTDDDEYYYEEHDYVMIDVNDPNHHLLNNNTQNQNDDIVPELESIPDHERPIFRYLQQQRKLYMLKLYKQKLQMQRKHELLVSGNIQSYDDYDDDDITIHTDDDDHDINTNDDDDDIDHDDNDAMILYHHHHHSNRPTIVTGVAGISPYEWSALERSAIEDALEQEERIRKDMNNNGNGNHNNPKNLMNRSSNNNNNNPNNSNNGNGNFNYSRRPKNYQHTMNSRNNNRAGGGAGVVGGVSSSSSLSSTTFSNNNSSSEALKRSTEALLQQQRDYHNFQFSTDVFDKFHMYQQLQYNAFKFKVDAAQCKVDAANKKLGKAVQSWRNRVANACQNNDLPKLLTLLNGTNHTTTNNNQQPQPNQNQSNVVNPKRDSTVPNNNRSSGANSEPVTMVFDTSFHKNNNNNISEEDLLVQQQFLHPHLEFLVPNCVSKSRNRALQKKGQEARELLTSFILRQSGGIYFMLSFSLKAGASSNSIMFGRSALDTACFYGDYRVVQLIVPEILKHKEQYAEEIITEDLSNFLKENHSDNLYPGYPNFLRQTCHDSGWTPMHYAVMSGCLKTVEVILSCEYYLSYSNMINDPPTYETRHLHHLYFTGAHSALTWRVNEVATPSTQQQQQPGTGSGLMMNSKYNTEAYNGGSSTISSIDLVDFVRNGTYKKEVETHGMALEEITDYYHLSETTTSTKKNSNHNHNNNSGSSKTNEDYQLEKAQYIARLNLISDRLKDVDKNGYYAWDDLRIEKELKQVLDPIINSATTKKVTGTGTTAAAVVDITKDTKTTYIVSSPPATTKSMKAISVTPTTPLKPMVSSSSSLSVASSSKGIVEGSTNPSSVSTSTSNKNEKKISSSVSGTANTVVNSKSSATTTSKKKKKGKNVQGPGNSVGVTPSSVSDSVIEGGHSQTQSHSSTAKVEEKDDDPVVAALLGMGFARDQILNGVKACGGYDLATVDNVVAWIFGGNDDTSPENEQEQINSVSTSVESKSVQETSNNEFKSVTNGPRTKEVKKKQQREENKKVPASLKREDQRRRNREWNNREQARHMQELQEKALKISVDTSSTRHGQTLLRTGVVTSVTGLTSGLPPLPPTSVQQVGAAPVTMASTIAAAVAGRNAAKSTTVPVRASDQTLRTSKSGSNAKVAAATPARTTQTTANINKAGADLDHINSNDTSSVASSNEYNSSKCPPLMKSNIIEVSNYNDDATVSTIGSTPAIIIQQMPSIPAPTSYAPPGFVPNNNNMANHYLQHGNQTYVMMPTANNELHGGGNGGASHRQWNHDSSLSPYTMSDLNLSAPAYIPPSSMKYSQQYEQQQGHAVASGPHGTGGYFMEPTKGSSMTQNHRLIDPIASSSSTNWDPYLLSQGQSRHYSSNSPSESTVPYDNGGRSIFLDRPSTQNHTGRDLHGLDPELLVGAFRSPHQGEPPGMNSSLGFGNLTTSHHSNVGSATIPGLNMESFGRTDTLGNKGTQHPFESNVEASIIESISTSTQALSWETNIPASRTKSTGGSLLLGTVMNSNNRLDESFIASTGYDNVLSYANHANSTNNPVGQQQSNAIPAGIHSSFLRSGALAGSFLGGSELSASDQLNGTADDLVVAHTELEAWLGLDRGLLLSGNHTSHNQHQTIPTQPVGPPGASGSASAATDGVETGPSLHTVVGGQSIW